MTPQAIDEAVGLFAAARQTMVPLAEMPAHCRPNGMAEAYDIQKAFISRHDDGVAGWKVGATNQAALALFDVDEPFLGPVFSKTIFSSPACLASRDFHCLFIESEFAFRLAKPLPGRAAPYGRDEILDAIDAVIPTFEIVSPRAGAIPKGDGPAAIADCAVGGGLVLGTPHREFRALDLAAQGVTLRIDGEQVGKGTGAMVMGHPEQALAWTVAKLAALDLPLEAGQIVSTGTCTGVTPIGPGQRAVADFGALGTVEVAFE